VAVPESRGVAQNKAHIN